LISTSNGVTDMIRRPFHLLFPILILLFDPIFKIYIYSFVYKRSVATVIDAHTASPELLFIFFLVGPLAAFALYMTRWWTPLAYFPLTAAQFYYYLTVMKEAKIAGDSQSLIFWGILLTLLAICMILAMLPKTFLLYYNPHLRWWEHHERFQVVMDCTVNNSFSGKIENISEGGVFLTVSESAPVDEILKLKFNGKEEAIKVSGKIVYRFVGDKNRVGYGVQFIDVDPTLKQSLREVIKELKKQNYDLAR